MLKKVTSKAAASKEAKAYASVRWASERCENDAWEKARLGAPGLGE
jgi:hypothetical protein